MPLQKEAVVFLLDAHPSMQAPYPSSAEGANGNSTRLSCAKDALEGMVSQLMIQSKQNEVGIIVLNTPATKHHLYVKSEDGDFVGNHANLTELTMPAVTRPSVELLKKIRTIECSTTSYEEGDVVHGMVVAEHALRQRTFKRSYKRRLVVFTDAAHRIQAPTEVLLEVIDKLRELECTLTVIGVDFEQSAQFQQALPVDQAAAEKEKEEDQEEEDDDHVSVDSDATEEEDDKKDDSTNIKKENEKLLTSVARLTGGSILAASTMKTVAEAALGKRIPKSIKKKISLHIAPGATLPARASLLLSKATFPTLKSIAVQLDDNKQVLRDGNDELMTNPVKQITDHWNQDQDVGEDDRTNAFRYGSSMIPMGPVDFAGLRSTCPPEPAIRILGYVGRVAVPRSLFIGPPYAVTGDKSQRVCGAIAALSRALVRQDQVALCTFVKTKNADPMLGALFPLEDNLFFIQLPFAGDLRKLGGLSSFEEFVGDSTSCDNLIDSLMLPEDALRSETIANPAIRSFRKTVKNRAVDPSNTAVEKSDGLLESMTTPSSVLAKASSALASFREAFPRKRQAEPDAAAKKKKSRYWGDREE